MQIRKYKGLICQNRDQSSTMDPNDETILFLSIKGPKRDRFCQIFQKKSPYKHRDRIASTVDLRCLVPTQMINKQTCELWLDQWPINDWLNDIIDWPNSQPTDWPTDKMRDDQLTNRNKLTNRLPERMTEHWLKYWLTYKMKQWKKTYY